MKTQSTIQFILQRPLDDIKANLIQTMNMCMGMVKNHQKVSLLLPLDISVKDAESKLNTIIKNYENYFEVNLVPYEPKLKLFNELDRFIVLKKYIDFSADYVFTRSALITIYCVLIKQKVIYESHNSNFAQHKILNNLYVSVFKKITRNDAFRLFVTISDNLNKFWINNGMPLSKTFAFHDGTSLVDQPNLIDVDIPFSNRNLLVTYTGSLYIDRGLDRIIKLAKEFNNLNFLVVGGPNENAIKFRKQCKAGCINNIAFTGPVEHSLVASYLSKSDILLALWSSKVPTINYCSPLKVFEYMASNKLIVADGFITIHEVLTHLENAVVVEPDNYDALKDAFNSILKNKEFYLNLSKNNYNIVKSNYNWKKRSKLILKKLT